MALKYQTSYTDILGNSYIIAISDIDFSGTQTNITLGVPAIQLESESNTDDVDAQILGQKATVRILNTTYGEFNEFFTSDRDKFGLQVIRNGDIIFSGNIIPENYSDGYFGARYFTDVVFADPTFQMKGKEMTLTGVQTLFDVLRVSLNSGRSATLYEAIDIYENSQDDDPTTDSMLKQTYVDVRAFKDMDCEEIVVEIMKRFNATVWWFNDSWYCARIGSLAASSVRFREYSSPGIFQSAAFHDVSLSTTDGDETLSLLNVLMAGGVVDFKPGFKKMIISQDYQTIENDEFDIIDHGDPLEETSDGWGKLWSEVGSLLSLITNSVSGIGTAYGGRMVYTVFDSSPNASDYMLYERYIHDYPSGLVFELDVDAQGYNDAVEDPATSVIRKTIFISIVLITSASTRYWTGTSWNATPTIFQYDRTTSMTGSANWHDLSFTESISDPGPASDGIMHIRVHGGEYETNADEGPSIFGMYVQFSHIKFKLVNSGLPNIENMILNVVADNDNMQEYPIELKTGDIPDIRNMQAILMGGFYLNSDQSTKTKTWDIQGQTEQESLNLVVGEEYALLMKVHRKLIATKMRSSLFNHWMTLRDDAGTYYRCIQSRFDTKKATGDVDYIELNQTV